MLFIRNQDIRSLTLPKDDSVSGVIEIRRAQYDSVSANRDDRSLVDEVGEISAGETGRASRDDFEVRVGG
jgi:hypothetical protein